MAQPFLGQIFLVGFNFAPVGWALCNGQLLSIAQNTALFSLLGTQYGGDGIQTFGLPNLQSRVPVGMGQGPGLSPYVIGEQTGSETVTLTVGQMPAHNHLVAANAATATVASPRGADLAQSETTTRTAVNTYSTPPMTALVTLDPATIQPNGGSQPHPNIQPVLAMNYIIALQGIFPSRN
ncbi:MAG: phage tail protein [Methylocella sp.]